MSAIYFNALRVTWAHSEAGAVLASLLLGDRGGRGLQRRPAIGKILSVMLKYTVFDIYRPNQHMITKFSSQMSSCIHKKVTRGVPPLPPPL